MIERKAATVDDSTPCSFEAVIATLGAIDSDGDVIVSGAFDNVGPVPVLWAHDQSMIPIGKATVQEVGDKIIARGELIDSRACAWLRHDFDNGTPVQEYSWGFLPTAVSFGEVDGKKVRFIEAIDLLEVSGVVRGASVGTRTVAVKSCSCGCGGSCHESPTWEDRLYAKYAAEQRRNERIIADVLAKMSYKRTPPDLDVLEAARAAAEALAIEPPRVYGLRPCRKGETADEILAPDVTGLYSGNVICVKEGLSQHEMLVTVGHELAHVAGITGEAEAEAYGLEFADLYDGVAA